MRECEQDSKDFSIMRPWQQPFKNRDCALESRLASLFSRNIVWSPGEHLHNLWLPFVLILKCWMRNAELYSQKLALGESCRTSEGIGRWACSALTVDQVHAIKPHQPPPGSEEDESRGTSKIQFQPRAWGQLQINENNSNHAWRAHRKKHSTRRVSNCIHTTAAYLWRWALMSGVSACAPQGCCQHHNSAGK